MLHTTIPTVKPVLQGSVAGLLVFNVLFGDTGISSGVKKCTIKASATAPVLVEISAQVITAFNAATTNVLTVGSDTTANQFLAAGDITEGTPGFYPAANAVYRARLVADTDIYVKYTQTGTAATTGEANIYIEATPLIPATTNTHGS